ncbi:MAG: hypothetical protein JAY63_16985 [Candidatus Thiodiazotropha taylori]|nr:hypothetical protein [Candidatus Thiodiazotropha taylori]
MATIRKDFDSYKIWQYSGHKYEAVVYCFRANTRVGELIFHKDSVKLPQNRLQSDKPVIHFPISRFKDIISIIRHESPLCLFLNLDKQIGMVATSEHEPIGEEES